MLPFRDAELVQIVDAELADATRRAQKADGGSWLACRPGCTPCCHGVFRISALDAGRLRAGVAELRARDPEQAVALRSRAIRFVEQLAAAFPGDSATGRLDPEDEAWEDFADLPAADAPCPVLDPATGRCTMYSHRPMTCRVFGPPVRNEGGIGICELCYVGASEQEILHGEMACAHTALEDELTREVDRTLAAGSAPEETVIAWAVLRG